MALGRADLPIAEDDLEAAAADHLGLAGYARALARFIAECETPMTVGIQGEWGSGKTSLMNMVKRELQALNSEALSETFETWAYGATGAADGLGFELLATITERLAWRCENDADVLRQASKIGKFVGAFGRGVLVTSKAVGAGLISGLSQDAIDGRKAIENFFDVLRGGRGQGGEIGLAVLRKEFSTLVDKVLATKPPAARLVVFVDDLDRIRPGAAVTLLEILKNFMDVERCVFVVACDYEVVRLGVRENFGITEEKRLSCSGCGSPVGRERGERLGG